MRCQVDPWGKRATHADDERAGAAALRSGAHTEVEAWSRPLHLPASIQHQSTSWQSVGRDARPVSQGRMQPAGACRAREHVQPPLPPHRKHQARGARRAVKRAAWRRVSCAGKHGGRLCGRRGRLRGEDMGSRRRAAGQSRSARWRGDHVGHSTGMASCRGSTHANGRVRPKAARAKSPLGAPAASTRRRRRQRPGSPAHMRT